MAILYTTAKNKRKCRSQTPIAKTKERSKEQGIKKRQASNIGIQKQDIQKKNKGNRKTPVVKDDP